MHDAQQISALAFFLPLLAGAQELSPIATESSIPSRDSSVTPISAEPELPAGEARIRAGIVLLGMLLDTMSDIQDRDSAESAVPVIMRMSRELQIWGQGFAALPPLDEETQSVYEKRYLPIINKLNERIQIQADRIAAAEFYGSTNLPSALVKLINSVQ